jgi:hypothetical protein
MQPFPPAQAEAISEALHHHFPVTGDPYWVPIEQRVATDAEDLDSVADPDGADLDSVDPDAGPELIDPVLFR